MPSLAGMYSLRVFVMLVLAALSGCACIDDHKHLSYGTDSQQGFDWYEPKGPLCIGDDNRENRPAIIAIHGGGWRGGDKSWGEQVAEEFCGSGYVVFSINYRLAPGAVWPAQIEDCQAALAYIKANAATFRVDPNRIGALGVSAGGHLAAMLAMRGPEKVQAAVCANGEGDLRVHGTEPIMADEGSIIADVLGGGPPFAASALADLSPAAFVTASAKVLVIHSTGDSNVFYSQGQRLHAALETAGATTEMVTVQGSCHSKCWKELRPLRRAREFFDQNLQ